MSSITHQKILLQSLIQEDLFTYCKRKVGEEEANILKGIMSDEVRVWFASNEVCFRKENRSELDFAQALVLDKIVLHWLKDYFIREHRLELTLNGCDRINTLVNHKVTCDPDFIIKSKDIYIEEITSYDGIVRATGALHLRYSKGQTLKRLAEEKKVYIMVLDVPTKSYTLVEVKVDTPMYLIEKIEKFGGKKGFGMDIGDNGYKKLKSSVEMRSAS